MAWFTPTTRRTAFAARPAGSYRRGRPLSAKSFMLVAVAVVVSCGAALIAISQASADEVASAFVPGALADAAIGAAALGSLMVSCLLAGLLARVSRSDEDPGEPHTGRGSRAS
jgi:fructose-specific phosphotransferase system IIC component